ncbi:MAG: LuxR C-terminal-related transcriptional regulator [Armatimonadota bacterium]
MFVAELDREIRRIASYIRVSTQEQADEGLSPETQRVRIGQWAALHDLHDIEEYDDCGLSGAWGYDPDNKPHRPDLARLVADIEAGKIDAVVVYRLDRIFRSPAVCARFMEEVVLPHGVHLISLHEGLDSTKPGGRMMMVVMAALAGYFREWSAENVSDNLQRRLEDGHPMGKAPFGWEYVTEREGEPRRLVRVEEQGRWLLTMKQMYLAGHSIATIVKHLHENGVRSAEGGEWWDECVIRRLLQNPKHAGYQEVGNGELVRATHYEDRYWELEDWERINQVFEQRTNMGAATAATPEFLLGDLLRCAHCGKRLYGRRARNRITRRYRCCTRPREGTPECRANSKPADVLERCVVSLLRELSLTDEVQRLAAEQAEALVDAEDGNLQARRAELLAGIDRVEADLTRWNQAFIDDPQMDREQFHAHSATLNDRKRRLQGRLAEVEQTLERRRSRLARLHQVQEMLRDFDALWEGMDIEERRNAVHMVVQDATLEHHADGSATLTVVPHFLAPRSFEVPDLHSRIDIGDGRLLSMRELALLHLHAQGLDGAEIARRWDVAPGAVASYAKDIRRELGVDLDQAALLAAEVIARYEHALPLEGRAQRDQATKDHELLTERQVQVLRLVLEGYKTPRIARTLGIPSPNTVYVHLLHARQKLGVTTNRAAAEKARYLGLLGDEQAGTPPTLTQRELALLKLIDEGRSLPQIAQQWDITDDCVTTVAESVRAKLDEQDLVQAAQIAREQIEAAMPNLPLEGRVRDRREGGGELALSDQQYRILRAFGDGLRYQDIAKRLDCHESVVGYHLRKVREMLGVESSKEAVEEARRLGLL